MRQTPLHDEYARSGGKIVDFHGWALPVQFAGIVQEHLHTRAKAGLFDCSHMGEFILEGHAAIAAFDRLVCSDMIGLRVGLCRYSALLDDRAGVIDDCVALKLDPDTMFLVVNAGPLDDVAALLGAIPGVRNISGETAKIDVQGPAAFQVMIDTGLDVAGWKYWNGARTQWRGCDIVVTRAGYTGELGYEVFVPNPIAVDLWRALLAHPAAAPCGLGARDTLRSEVGYPLNGEDLGPGHTPLESGMERFIAWNTEFPGKARLEAQRDAGDCPVLVAIASADRRAPRHGFELTRGGDPAGAVTSGTFGPSVARGVGLARVPRHAAAPGTQLNAGPKALSVEVCTIPIYKNGTCRAAV